MTGIINEEWRSVSGFANYQVSNIGRIRNVKTERILKITVNSNGYWRVSLYKGGETADFLVHRLVALEFIENPEGKSYIDHIDRNRLNSCINNLRWVTRSQNHMSMTKSLNKTSIFKGVSFSKYHDKWHCRVKINGKHQHLGYLKNEKDAAKKYNEVAIQLFGEYACLNEIED